MPIGYILNAVADLGHIIKYNNKNARYWDKTGSLILVDLAFTGDKDFGSRNCRVYCEKVSLTLVVLQNSEGKKYYQI